MVRVIIGVCPQCGFRNWPIFFDVQNGCGRCGFGKVQRPTIFANGVWSDGDAFMDTLTPANECSKIEGHVPEVNSII